MKFPLSLDLRRETLAENLGAIAVIDAAGKRIMLIYPDEDGSCGHAAAVVDTLNVIPNLRLASVKL